MRTLLEDRRILLTLLVTAVAIAIGSVSIVILAGDTSGGGTPAPAAQGAASGDATIDIADFKYAPENLTVKAGSRVTWTNDDAAPHTATAGGAFDTGTLRKGESMTITLDKAGTYAYICEFHPFMKATVVVR